MQNMRPSGDLRNHLGEKSDRGVELNNKKKQQSQQTPKTSEPTTSLQAKNYLPTSFFVSYEAFY